MPDRKRVYWDACVFLRYVNDDKDSAPTIDQILQQAEKLNSGIQIVTSIISLTEVSGGIEYQGRVLLTQEIEDRVNKLWEDRRTINLVEYFELIALEARSLIRRSREKRWGLKPIDAIHLATAKYIKADEVHTFDEHLEKYCEFIGINICKPTLPQPPLF
jgi:predicted nucleic acid-binding protein